MIRLFSTVHTADEVLQRIQTNIDSGFRKLLSVCPLLEGVLLKDIELSNVGFVRVEHKLGRKPNGYLVLRRNSSAIVYDSPGYALEDQALMMRSSAQVSVTLWVF
jgi:hypothetical protein